MLLVGKRSGSDRCCAHQQRDAKKQYQKFSAFFHQYAPLQTDIFTIHLTVIHLLDYNFSIQKGGLSTDFDKKYKQNINSI